MNFICQENLEAIILKRYMNEEKKKTANCPGLSLSIFSPYFGKRVQQKGERRAVGTACSTIWVEKVTS